MANSNAKNPLSEEFINAQADEQEFSKDIESVLKKGYQGKIASNSSYDDVYGMTTLSVAIPVLRQDGQEVGGVILMVSMIDRQTMGLREGRYLITLSVLVSVFISYFVAAFFSRYLSRPLAEDQ